MNVEAELTNILLLALMIHSAGGGDVATAVAKAANVLYPQADIPASNGLPGRTASFVLHEVRKYLTGGRDE